MTEHTREIWSAEEFLKLQRQQFRHDRRNHSDVLCLPRADRLKHYGLHFAKYTGRVARGDREPQPLAKTVVDAALVCLSAANALSQRLDRADLRHFEIGEPLERMKFLADAAGRFADACEKIDHLEEFHAIAKAANLDMMRWVLAESSTGRMDLKRAIAVRRAELGERAFYVDDE